MDLMVPFLLTGKLEVEKPTLCQGQVNKNINKKKFKKHGNSEESFLEF